MYNPVALNKFFLQYQLFPAELQQNPNCQMRKVLILESFDF